MASEFFAGDGDGEFAGCGGEAGEGGEAEAGWGVDFCEGVGEVGVVV